MSFEARVFFSTSFVLLLLLHLWGWVKFTEEGLWSCVRASERANERICVCVRACAVTYYCWLRRQNFFFKILLLSTHISFVLYHSINYLFCYLFVLCWFFFFDIIIILFVRVTVSTVVNVIANYAVHIILYNIFEYLL